MERGWGLALDNSADQVGFFGNKQVFGDHHHHHRSGTSSGLIMFPVNSRVREDDDGGAAKSSPPRGEVDFFAERNKPTVKTESSHAETSAACREFNVNTGLQLVTANTGSDESTVDDGVSYDVEDKRAKIELAHLQVELERMHTENQRLKGMLTQVNENYSALQMHFMALMQHQQNSTTDSTKEHQTIVERKSEEKKLAIVPRQLLDLGVGGCGTADDQMAEEQSNSLSEERTISGSPQNNNMELSRNKRIGRDESPESDSWHRNKTPKLDHPAKPIEQTADATMRKARVSVRARSEAPMISDGCQWRKYGQKMAKGNPCPRAYYRCTMAVGCPVRKQVQRCADDRTILITTYEGTHNHPLPPAAMAMASTTSAAASMLLSGSMPSADGLMNPNFLARTILPCSSNMATISASAPFPTVTLDLTQTPTPLQYQRPPPVQFQLPFPQNFAGAVQTPAAPQGFGQGLYNQSKFSGLQISQAVSSEAAQLQGQSSQQSFADSLSAATAAITSDPNFTAALAAAISSIIGGSHQNNANQSSTTPNNPNVNTSNSNNCPGN